MKIKICFEYQCFPLWIYNSKEELIDNNIPKELKGENEMLETLLKLQKKYNDLYTDNSIEFKYNGFKSSEEKIFFEEKYKV